MQAQASTAVDHLGVAAQVAIEHDSVGAAAEFADEGAKNLGGSCVF